MKPSAPRYHKLIFVLLLSLLWMSSAAGSFDDSEIRHVEYPAWFNDNPFNDLAEILNASIANGKKGLLILFTTEGCSYCERFIRTSLADPDIASIVQTDFESVGLEIFDDTEMTTPGGETMSIKQFAADEKVQFSPTLLFYGKDGKRILRLTGYQSPERFTKILDYVANDHYRSVSFRNYLLTEKPAGAVAGKPDQMSLALTDDPLFAKPPYLLDRSRVPASRPLLVIFEEPDCQQCDNFHAEVLSQNKIRGILAQFEIVRLDAKDNKRTVLAPDGKRITPAQWYEQSDFTRSPAMLFFDENGTEVLQTDALVLPQRMVNSLNYVLAKAYKKGWSYQRFARSTAIERLQNNQQ
jgi:thioredoxin-related protein